MDMFTSMSDLIADAEDFVQALANSANPEVHALSTAVIASIEEMKRLFRRRLKVRAGAIENRKNNSLKAVTGRWLIVGATAIATALLLALIRKQLAAHDNLS